MIAETATALTIAPPNFGIDAGLYAVQLIKAVIRSPEFKDAVVDRVKVALGKREI
jgi:hypothetical protein